TTLTGEGDAGDGPPATAPASASDKNHNIGPSRPEKICVSPSSGVRSPASTERSERLDGLQTAKLWFLMNLGVTTVVMNGAGVRLWNARDAQVSDCGEGSPGIATPRPAARRPRSQTTTPGWTRP